MMINKESSQVGLLPVQELRRFCSWREHPRFFQVSATGLHHVQKTILLVQSVSMASACRVSYLPARVSIYIYL